MTVALSSPITGAAQTGFTSPTYTLIADSPPANNGKQWVVSAVGGTQTGVDINSVSKPFTLSFFKPVSPRSLPQANALTGIIKSVPVNTYKLIVRKGVLPAANQSPVIASMTCELKIPAGSDTYEPTDLQAMISAAIGALSQISAGLGDTVLSGVM